MKILIVAMPGSVHTARWIDQLKGEGWKLYLFPSIPNTRHDALHSVNFCMPFHFLRIWLKTIGLEKVYDKVTGILTPIIVKFFPGYFEWLLGRYIVSIKPDIVHTLETQKAGYMLKAVKDKYFQGKKFPAWWHTNWGSDIYLFGRFAVHQNLIHGVLQECDYYSCECERDVLLARDFGFKGEVMPVYPNAGGFKLDEIARLRDESVVTSARKVIMLKGYQGWTGRALVGVRALERCGNLLADYTIVIHSNTSSQDIQIAATLLSQSLGVEVKLLPENTPHRDILKYHSLARISIGLGISDGISTSLLEAMAMGSLPVQSNTAAADEWIKHSVTGFIVPPEDPEIIEQALRKALSNDDLVDQASAVNFNIVKDRLAYEKLQEKTIASYRYILNKTTE